MSSGQNIQFVNEEYDFQVQNKQNLEPGGKKQEKLTLEHFMSFIY